MARNFSVLKETGFTLLEILVVIGIIALVSSVMLANMRGGEKSLALERAAHTVAQDFRAASERALTGKPFPCAAGSISGYGIYFDSTAPGSYFIFAECNGNNQYDAGQDEIVENIVLEGSIKIANLAPVDPLSIIFMPPDPSVAFNGSGSFAQIILSPDGVFISPFTYEEDWFIFGWADEEDRAACDTTNPSEECPSSFPALVTDLPVVYDRACFFSCSPFTRYSVRFTKQETAVVTINQRIITINERGTIDID